MIKKVNWNGHELHCIELLINDELEWCFFGREVVEVLGYEIKSVTYTKYVKRYCEEDEYFTMKKKELEEELNKSNLDLFEIARKGEVLLTELGVYSLVLSSPLEEAKDFKRFVKQLIKDLRVKSGLEQWQLWRMLDKEHQKSISVIIGEVGNKDCGKDNIIANKEVNKLVSCELFDFNKPLKKAEMEEYDKTMLLDRQEVLQKYCDNLIISQGSHTKAKEMTLEWMKYKYKHFLKN